MIDDFVLSADGFSLLREYKDKFDCLIRIDEPSGEALTLDAGDKSFRITENNVDDLKDAIIQSLKSGKNLLLEENKNNEVKYEEDILY